jgi:hypothetical protein
MNTTLATAVDVDALVSNANPSNGLWLAFAVLVVGGIAASIYTVVGLVMLYGSSSDEEGGPKRTRDTRGWFIAPFALVLAVTLLGSAALVSSHAPDSEAEIIKAFRAEYPNLTLTAEDIDCVESIVIEADGDEADSCAANRQVEGGFAKVEFSKYRGQFVVTTPGGATVTSDSDLKVLEGQ